MLSFSSFTLLFSCLQSSTKLCGHLSSSFGKEVIQPQVPLRLPCYDFTPVIGHTVASDPPKLSYLLLVQQNSHGVTGSVYKTRERIHRDMLIRDY